MHLKNQLSVFHNEIPEHAQRTSPAGNNVLWAETAVVVKKAKLRKPLTLDWTSAERPSKAIWIDQQEKRFWQPFRRYPDAVTCGSGRLREEDGTRKTALSIFPDYRTSFISDVLYTSHTLHYTSVIVLTHASKWLIFIQHFQLKYLSVDRIQNQKRIDL